MNNRLHQLLKTGLPVCLFLLSLPVMLWAQVPISGTFAIPGAQYPTLQAAIADINFNGVTAPGVTFNIAANYTETAPAGGFRVTATGSSTAPLIFQKSGSGNNPKFLAQVGIVNVTSSSVTTLDGIIRFVGSDYVTLDRLDFEDANTPVGGANNSIAELMDFGVGFFKASALDGCQNNIIQNCTITLNGMNGSGGGTGGPSFGSNSYNGATGLLFSPTKDTAISAAAVFTITNASGTNSGNKIYSNTFNTCYTAIGLFGNAVSAPYSNADNNNDVGGNIPSTGNTINSFGTSISNYFIANSAYSVGDVFITSTGLVYRVSATTGNSGAAAPTATANPVTNGGLTLYYLYTCVYGNGVLVNNQYGFNFSNNIVKNTNGAGTAPALNGLRGLYIGPAPTASSTINNNTFTIVSAGSATAAVEGINNVSGTGTGVIAITNNTINLTQGMGVSSTLGTLTVGPTTAIPMNGITTNTAITNLNITGNTISTTNYGTAGTMTLIGNSGLVTGTVNLSNNIFTNINFPGTSAFTGALSYLSNTGGSATLNLNIVGNTFSNISFTTTAATGTHIFINNTGASSNFQLRKNVWDSITYKASNSIYLIQNTGVVQTSYIADSNRIQTGFVRTGASGIFGCLHSNANLTANSVPFQISNNNFSNITSTTLGGSGTFYGIFSGEQHGSTTNHPRKLVYNNVISNINYYTSGTLYGMHVDGLGNAGANGSLIYNDTVSNITCAGPFYGMNMGSKISATATTNVYGCLITNINSTGTTVTSYGISATAGTTGTNIYQNKIGGLQVANNVTTGTLNGIFTNTVGLYNIYNNVIGDLRAPDANSGIALHGINITSGTTVNLSHNNIYLTGTSNTGTNFGSSGIYIVGTTTAVTLQNNIIVNTCTAKGTGVAAAFRRTSTAMTGYGTGSNTNVFYTAATPSGSSPLYFDGTNKDSTMALFKARVTPRESNSFTENVNMYSVSVSSPNFLQNDSTLLSVVEGNGTAIASVNNDFNGRIRAGYAGYTGTATLPDIGAYEQEGIGSDFSPPAITMTALTNTIMPGGQNFKARIVDVSGVTGAMLFYKKGINGTYTSLGGTLDSGTTFNGRWAFTLTASAAGAVAAGDSIYYFVVTADGTLNQNMSSYPMGVSGTYGSVIPPATTNYYRIQNTLQGSFTVGISGNYPSLTGSGGAFADINLSIVTGDITLTIVSDITETGTNALNATTEMGTGNYTISIVPDGNTLRTLAGPATSSLITFNGCDRVKIDGRYNGSGRYLTFRNRNNGAVSTFRFQNDACRDTVMYANIESLNQNATIYFGATAVSGNDSNAVMYCAVSDTAGSTTTSTSPNSVFYSNVSLNSENTIAYNEIYNYMYQGINISGSLTGHDNWSIIGNAFYQGANGRAKAGTTSSATQAIYIQTGSGYKIMNNSIGGSAPDRSGDAYKALYNTTNNTTFKAIDLNVGTASVTTVSGNTISNISSVATTGTTVGFIGINITGGLVDVLNNTIGGGASLYDTIMEASYTAGGGIVVSGGTTVNVTGNTIGNISNYTSVTNASRTTGIYVSGGTTVAVKNNTIRDIRSAFTTTLTTAPTGSAPSGIFAQGAASCTIEGNTIYNITNIATSTAPSHAFGITFSGTVAAAIKRNRIYNITGNGTGTDNSAPGIYGMYITTAGHTISHNQISLGANALGESRVFGIRDTSATGTNNYYYNTVVIEGQTQSGANNSYAFQRINTSATPATMVLRNNIFFNSRITMGTGYNYAVGFKTATNTNVNNIGYNLMVQNDTNRVAEMPAGTGMGVGVLKGMYTTSYNTNWMESSSAIPSGTFFSNTVNGDLGINTTSPLCWYANGKGIALNAQSGDFISATTLRSATIAGGSTDIGSVEFNTATTPPVALASGAPIAGTKTTYTFANRNVAEIIWGATGSVPTVVNVTYFSGMQQPNVLVGSTQYNGFVRIAATGGSAYTADVNIIADSAMYGNVTNAAASRLAVYNTSWSLLSGSASSVSGLLSSGVSATAAGLSGDYTGTDQANPLPVKLTAFTATASGKDVVLSWTTQSELNNIGFDIERSTDNINFESVGFVKGQGNAQKQVRYESIDQSAFANAGANRLYYRLKQLDKDGRYNYSGVAVVTLAVNENNMIAVQPNPFVGSTKLVLLSTVAGVANITVTDISGKTVLTKTLEVNANTNTIELEELNDLNSGVYFLSSSINGQTQALKLVKTQ